MNELWLYHQLGLEGIVFPPMNRLDELDPFHFFDEETGEIQWPVYEEAKGG